MSGDGDQLVEVDGGGAVPQSAAVEARWPITLALLTYIAITLALRLAIPDRQSLGPRWLVPGLEIGLLVALLATDPAQLARRTRRLRPIAITLIVALTIAALVSDAVLIVELVEGSKATDDAAALLASGALIWLGTALVFGLLYWELDSGGPLARYLHERPFPDFAFTQQLSPELAPPGWRPRYTDYLVLGITTSTAFSPTDVMPVATWAKLTMALQSLISLTVIGLVIARAVNVLG